MRGRDEAGASCTSVFFFLAGFLFLALIVMPLDGEEGGDQEHGDLEEAENDWNPVHRLIVSGDVC